MKLTITVLVGKSPVLFELTNVQETEYQTLMSELYDDPTEDQEYCYTFVYDGGLSELTIRPFFVQAVYATRSQP